MAGSGKRGHVDGSCVKAEFLLLLAGACGPDRKIYLAEPLGGCLRVIDRDRQMVETVLYSEYSSDLDPCGLLFDKGKLFIADARQHCIYELVFGPGKQWSHLQDPASPGRR